MRAQPTQRTLLCLALGLSLLSPAAMGRCPDSLEELLGQQRGLAGYLRQERLLLKPFMEAQDLKMSQKRLCGWEHTQTFPEEAALRGLSQPAFLQVLQTALDSGTLNRLQELCQGLSDPTRQVLAQVLGFRSNLHCMARMLHWPVPTPGAVPRTPTRTPAPGTFQWKVEGCRFLSGFHHFMQSVSRVLGDWEASPSHGHRHSRPRRTAPSRRGSRRDPR